jgi:hypothetical protein
MVVLRGSLRRGLLPLLSYCTFGFFHLTVYLLSFDSICAHVTHYPNYTLAISCHETVYTLCSRVKPRPTAGWARSSHACIALPVRLLVRSWFCSVSHPPNRCAQRSPLASIGMSSCTVILAYRWFGDAYNAFQCISIHLCASSFASGCQAWVFPAYLRPIGQSLSVFIYAWRVLPHIFAFLYITLFLNKFETTWWGTKPGVSIRESLLFSLVREGFWRCPRPKGQAEAHFGQVSGSTHLPTLSLVEATPVGPRLSLVR